MKEKITEALTEFAEKEHPQSTVEHIHKWLGTKINRKEKESGLLSVWENTSAEADSSTVRSLNAVYSKYIFKNRQDKGSLKPVFFRKSILSSVAAVLIIIFATTGITGYVVSSNLQKKNEFSLSLFAYDSDTTLRFKDGSEVILSPGSALFFSPNYEKTRSVSLAGEAYFKIQKNKKAFRVNTPDSYILVHGTEFNVKANPSDSRVESVLLNGSIEFFSESGNTFLEPNKKLVFNRELGRLQIFDINPEYEFGNGYFSFDKTQIRRILDLLQGLYGTMIELETATIGVIEFTGSINRENSLEHTLDVLTLSTGTAYEIKSGSVLIKR